jgi:hypothetical protein
MFKLMGLDGRFNFYIEKSFSSHIQRKLSLNLINFEEKLKFLRLSIEKINISHI